MNRKAFQTWSYLFLAAILVISCRSHTQVTQQQVDEAFKGKPVSDILVIVVAQNEKTRRVFERAFVIHLQKAGVEAISSLDVIPIPDDLAVPKEEILKVVEQYENDAVIVTHLMGLQQKESFTRRLGGAGGYSGGFYGYYGYTFDYARDTGYSTINTTVQLETNLFDVQTEKLIWSGQTKSWLDESEASRLKAIGDVIEAVVGDLEKNGLIAPKGGAE